MYVLIVNQEPLGRALAKTLVDNGHEVAYLDEDIEYCNVMATELGCLVINGESTNIAVLQEAGIARADVVVALLEKDIENIMVGLFARQFGVARIMARLRQVHYAAAYELAGITEVFSAFDFLLNQMVTAIEDPNIRQVMVLDPGLVEIASLDIPAGSPLLDRSLNALWEHPDFPAGALVLGLFKSGDRAFRLPREKPRVATGDDILVLGTPSQAHALAALLARKRGW